MEYNIVAQGSEMVQLMSSTRDSNRKGKGPMNSDGEGSNDDRGGFILEEEPEASRGKFMLVGKLWASRPINVKAAIDTMVRLRNPIKAITGNVVDAKERTFVFRFDGERDKARVLEGQPWHFEKFVWCFNEPNESGKVTDVLLYHFPIWSRVYDLPISERSSEANIRRIGASLGTFLEADSGSNCELNRAIRVRIIRDIRKPLQATIPITMKDNKVVHFDVKYERLPIFCYRCGVMRHEEKDCEHGPYEEDELHFGEWLRASP
ncbi:uncharacterized protein LOC141587508 [Silene latifolia]|uniref:uncharacterized protein LOC141587508 n=1 Tax=Silene latifolia TaxID=37657 RepID=UPI003D77836A